MEPVCDKKAPLISCYALMHYFKLILWYFSQFTDAKLSSQIHEIWLQVNIKQLKV